jgi:hypothetical protein
MNVVGHHDKVPHTITLAVEIQQRVGHDLGQLRPSEQTTSTTRIKEVFAAALELLLKVCSMLLSQCGEENGPVLRSVIAMKSQPVSFRSFPPLKHLTWNRVVCAKRDEYYRACLGPVRSEMFVDEQLSYGIEEFAKHWRDLQ